MTLERRRRIFLSGWIGVATVTVLLTVSPAFGFWPLAELPWSGPGVVFTWILAAFDMPPSAPLYVWAALGLPTENILRDWRYWLPAIAIFMTVTPALILSLTNIWMRTAGRRILVAYTVVYAVALVVGGIYTAIEWNTILD